MTHHLETIAVRWLINIGFGMVAVVIALLMVLLIDRVVLRKIDLIDEIKKGNLAAAITVAAILGAAAYIIGAAVK